MEKKEFHRHYLPHFQQPGQAYFVTWCLKDAVPTKALFSHTQKMELLKSQIRELGSAGLGHSEVEKLEIEYYDVRRKYMKAYDDLLDTERNPSVNLSKPENTKIIMGSLKFWERKMLDNCAFTVMSNHIHWVFETLEKDNEGNPVYLQDLLQSVKGFSAYQVNKLENRTGNLWQKESFDTTIRDDKHLYYAIKYTLNNTVTAGLVSEWKLWPGTWCRYNDF
jgi:REP element-mobilizing transposase RayT